MGRILKHGRLNSGMVINTHLVTLDSVIGLRRWMRKEVSRRSVDRNFSHVKYDLLSELLTEEAHLNFRNRFAPCREFWRQVSEPCDNGPKRLESLMESFRKRFKELSAGAQANEVPGTDTDVWNMELRMSNITVGLTFNPSQGLQAVVPFGCTSSEFSSQSVLPGYVPYTDEQLMDVLSLLDAVIPDIEKEVGKRVARSLARREAGKIRETAEMACVRRIMDETGLSYTVRPGSRGVRILIPASGQNNIDLRLRRPVSGLEPDKVLSAVASVKKAADILNRSIVIDI